MTVHAGVFFRPKTQKAVTEASVIQPYWFSIAEIQEIDALVHKYAETGHRPWRITDATEDTTICKDRIRISDGKDDVFLEKLLTDRNHTIVYNLGDKSSAATFQSLLAQFSTEMTNIYFKGLRERRLARMGQAPA